MYLKAQTVKKASGKSYTYYRLAESYRENGQVKHRILAELGPLKPEEVEYLARRFAGIAGIELGEDLEELEVHGLSYFGAPLLVEHLLEVLHLSHWVQEAVEGKRLQYRVVDALKVMLCAHLFKSGSRAELAVWDWQQKLFWHPHRVGDLEYQHLLRSLSVLTRIKDQIERKLFLHLGELFDYTVDLVFYDLTSSYVEGVADWSQILKRGYSRDKRGDCKQMVIGLVVTERGFPVTFRVFEGNRLDKSTLEEMVGDLKDRFSIKRCIWVSDAGLLSQENVKLLEESPYEYILGMGGAENRKALKAAIEKAKGLPQKEFKDSQFWEVELEQEGQSPEAEGAAARIVVVESEGRQKKTAAIFERRLEKVRQAFRSLERQVQKGKYVEREAIREQAVKALHQSRVKKYFSFQAERGKLRWTEDEEAVQERKANAGKYGLLTKSKLPAQEVISAYRTLLVVEDVFLVLKDILDLRPFWHKCDDNVEGHVLLAVWSYLLFWLCS
ncbi:MAG: IS1634 family transposase [Deltaproteobacteria bacterium]|nr:IS1634 family transposase [Deltaproteobacteria bacterium]